MTKHFYLYYIVLQIIIHGKSVSSSPVGINAILKRMSNLNIGPNKLECVLRVVRQEVPCDNFFTVLHQSNYGDLIIQNLSADNCYSFIVRTPKPQNWLLRSESYIILVKNLTEFIGGVEKLSKDFGWNVVARFFIAVRSFENEDYLPIFKTLAKLNIYHVHIITAEPTDEIFVYTYNPSQNKQCGRVYKDTIKKNPCRGFSDVELNKTEVENAVRSCPIHVFARENPPNVIFKTNKKFMYHGVTSTGIEQYMLKNIAKIENYSFHYIAMVNRINNNRVPSKDCASSHLMQNLQKHPLGISIGGFLLMKKGSDCYDFIWGYCYGNINIYTAVQDVQNWRKVYQGFGGTTWFLIASSCCSVTIISIIIYKKSFGKVNKKRLAIQIWGYLNNRPDKEFIKIRKLRFMLIIWIWFTFFIINFYNTALYTLLTAPDKRGMTVKPEKLFSSPLKPCVSVTIKHWFQLIYDVTIPSLDWDECLYEATALNAVTENKELYTMVSEPTHYKREYKYLDKFGHPKLDRWRFGTGDFVFSIITNRGFPLLEKFQRYASYHFESGLLLKHTEDIYHQFMIFTEFKAFNLQDFRIHFTILFVGYVVSFIAYVIEINQFQK